METLKTNAPRELNERYGDHGTTAILGRYIEDTYGAKYTSRTSYYLLFRTAEFTTTNPGKSPNGRIPQR